MSARLNKQSYIDFLNRLGLDTKGTVNELKSRLIEYLENKGYTNKFSTYNSIETAIKEIEESIDEEEEEDEIFVDINEEEEEQIIIDIDEEEEEEQIIIEKSETESIEIDEETIDKILEEEIIVQEMMIKYGLSFNLPGNAKLLEISHKDVNDYDFTKYSFNEFIIAPDYVHPYFDFDSIQSEEQYLSVIDWLDSLTDVFGDYSIGGYTNNQEISDKYGYRFIDGDKHYLSLHVVYFQRKISAKDMMRIMKRTEKKGFEYNGVHELCDANVYKLETRQVFRHVLSDKIFSLKNPSQNKANHGTIIKNNAAANQIIQIRGDEPLITEESVKERFTKKETAMEQRDRIKQERRMVKEEKKSRKFTLDDIDYTDSLIELDDETILSIMCHFEPEHDNLQKTLAPLRHSPLHRERVRNLYITWYGQREHSNGTEKTVDSYMTQYTYEKNNIWFFSLMKQLDEDVRREYIDNYAESLIDMSVNINNSDLTLEEVRKRRYHRNEFYKLIGDLRGVIGFAKSRWFVKEKKDNHVFIRETSTTKLREELLFKPFVENNTINMFQILNRYINYFVYDDAVVMKESEDNIINMWQGFKYQEIDTDNYEIIQPFLNHIKTVICANNEAKYDYFLKFYANIFQNITVKNGTFMIIHGEQGSGKSIAAEIFCELLGNMALKNVDDINKVFGKFNGLIKRHLLININEPPEANDSFKFMGQIKAKTTQKSTTIETKGVDAYEIDSWANFTMTTNSYLPVLEERGDRRIIYFETDNSRVGDKAYFDNLMKQIQPRKQGDYNPEFMGVLLHYMRTQINVVDWDAETLIRTINSSTNVDNNEQLERQYLSLNLVEKWIVDNYDLVENGFLLEEIRISDKYSACGIAKKLMAVTTSKRMTARKATTVLNRPFLPCDDCAQVRVYTLKNREQIASLYDIIDYKKNQHVEDLDENEICDEVPVKQ